MIRKDYIPIKFEILQSDMEDIMAALEMAIKSTAELNINYELHNVKCFFQHKINKHIQRGDWK